MALKGQHGGRRPNQTGRPKVYPDSEGFMEEVVIPCAVKSLYARQTKQTFGCDFDLSLTNLTRCYGQPNVTIFRRYFRLARRAGVSAKNIAGTWGEHTPIISGWRLHEDQIQWAEALAKRVGSNLVNLQEPVWPPTALIARLAAAAERAKARRVRSRLKALLAAEANA
jgi:hypothetical protein